MYRYYQRTEEGVWQPLHVKKWETAEQDALEKGARKLTILAVNALVADGDDADVPRNRAEIGYRGPWYADIDCAGDLDLAIESGRELLGKLVRMGVPETHIEIYASGSKGIHILVSEDLFGSNRFIRRLPEIYKEMARELYVTGLDYQVYCGGRGNAFRIVNLRRDDGNYRVRLTASELGTLTADEYRVLTREPRALQFLQPPVKFQSAELTALFETARKRVNGKQKIEIIASSADLEKIQAAAPNCIQALCDWKTLKSDTNFNQAATQMAAYIVQAKVPQDASDALAARLVDSADSSKYNTQRARRQHFEGQLQYVKNSQSFKFSCNAIRALLSKRPCDGCAIEASAAGQGDDSDISAEAALEGYIVKTGDARRRLTNFTLKPIEAFIEIPQDGTAPRRLGIKTDVIKGGVKIASVIIKESSFSGRSSFLREMEGLDDLVFLGTDNEVQRIKKVVYGSGHEIGEIYKVHTAGIHAEAMGGSTLFTYVEPGMSINSVKVRDTHQLLDEIPAPPRYLECAMLQRGDADADAVIAALFRINRPREIGLMIGWFVAAHFKSHLMKLYAQFPLLSVWGNAGAGKSKTVGLVSWLCGTSYEDLDSGVAVPSITTFALLAYASSTMTVPRILEEFNKSQMRRNYDFVSEVLKKAWAGETELRGTLNKRQTSMSRLGATVEKIPISAPLVVTSEQEVQMPALQERMLRVQLSKDKIAGRQKDYTFCQRNRIKLRELGKVLMAQALNTTLDEVRVVMESTDELVPETLDYRPRYTLQTVVFGLKMLREVLVQLEMPQAIEALDVAFEGVTEYLVTREVRRQVQSEIDIVITKIALIVALAKAHPEHRVGSVFMREGLTYVTTPEYFVFDPVICHANYVAYCSKEEHTVPVIESTKQFLKLLREESYFAKEEQFQSMANGRKLVFLSLDKMEEKGIDVSMVRDAPENVSAAV